MVSSIQKSISMARPEKFGEVYLEYKFGFKDRIRILLGRKIRVKSFLAFTSPTLIHQYKPEVSVFRFSELQNQGSPDKRRKLK